MLFVKLLYLFVAVIRQFFHLLQAHIVGQIVGEGA